MFNTLQKHILITLSFFTLLVFSCKSQIPQDSSYLSMNTSGSISNNFNFPNPLNGGSEVDLENYDVKSALGPAMTTECALDKTNFAGNIEKFNLSANPNADYMYRKVESGELLDFSTEEKSDIWYIFTNTTGTDIRIPYFEVATEQEEEPNPGDNPGGQGGSDNPGGQGGSSDNPGGQGGQGGQGGASDNPSGGGSSDNPGGQGGSSDNPGGGGSSDNPGGQGGQGGTSDNPGGQGGQGGSSDNDNPGSNEGDFDDGTSKTPDIVAPVINLPEVNIPDDVQYKDMSKYVDLSKSKFKDLLENGIDSAEVCIYFRQPAPSADIYVITDYRREDYWKTFEKLINKKREYISDFKIDRRNGYFDYMDDDDKATWLIINAIINPVWGLPLGFGAFDDLFNKYKDDYSNANNGYFWPWYRASFRMSYLQWAMLLKDHCIPEPFTSYGIDSKTVIYDAFYGIDDWSIYLYKKWSDDYSHNDYYCYPTKSARDACLDMLAKKKIKDPAGYSSHKGDSDFNPSMFQYKYNWYTSVNSPVEDEELHPKNWHKLKDHFSNLRFDNPKNYKLEYKIGNWIWLPEESEFTGNNHVYCYCVCPVFGYYQKSVHSINITNGKLGFGIYINRPGAKNWFISIKETDGAQGRGYYLNGKLVGKKATVAFSIPKSEDSSNTNNTIDVNNALNSSSLNQNEIINNTLKRIKKAELPQPLRLVPKEESQGTSEETKGLNDSKSNLGDKVGSKQVFVELLTQNGFNYYRNATCKLVRIVSTVYGDRTLVIYEDDALRDKPGDQYYQSVADLFLLPGLNNDIYDKITNVFGSEWGYYNSTFLKSLSSSGDYPLIKKTNTITLFYTDIGNIGNSSEYLSAAYLPTDIYTNESYPGSNERLMIHVHAPKATNGYFSESILGITREFERLIHDQYFSEDLKNYCYNEQIKKFGSERPVDKSGFTDYFFSFLAKVIAANTLRDNKYDVPASFNLFSLTDKTFTNLFGLDKYYLYGMDRFNLEALTLKAQEGDDYQSIAKAVISSFAYYIYTNFGSGFIRKYALGNKVGLEGIVEAINSIYGTQYTLSELLASWAVATVSSSVLSTSRPYTFNYANRFKVQGVDYPNINFANTTAYRSSKKGIPSAGSYYVVNNSSSCYRVASSRIGNYKAYAPELPEGLDLRILAVPKYLYPLVTP